MTDFAMHEGWQPEIALFRKITKTQKKLDLTYLDEDVKEFKSYWMTQPKRQSNFAWHTAFVKSVQFNRQTNQIAPPAPAAPPKPPGLYTCSNAQALLAKYGTKLVKYGKAHG